MDNLKLRYVCGTCGTTLSPFEAKDERLRALLNYQEVAGAEATLVSIQELLDGVEWKLDTLKQIAQLLVDAGYPVRDTGDR